MERLFALSLAQARRQRGTVGLWAAAFKAMWDIWRHAPGQHLRQRAAGSPDRRQGGTMEFWRQDLRLSLRRLTGRPALTLAAAATLALGIGANSAVFSLVDAVFLKPAQAVRDPHLMAVAWAASFVPAQKASRLDPAQTLRCE